MELELWPARLWAGGGSTSICMFLKDKLLSISVAALFYITHFNIDNIKYDWVWAPSSLTQLGKDAFTRNTIAEKGWANIKQITREGSNCSISLYLSWLKQTALLQRIKHLILSLGTCSLVQHVTCKTYYCRREIERRALTDLRLDYSVLSVINGCLKASVGLILSLGW